jgi:hypothetical protein
MILPPFPDAEAYAVFARWPDDRIMRSVESRTMMDEAFDAAAEVFEKFHCEVRVIRFDVSVNGFPVGVVDVTAQFFDERGLDPDRSYNVAAE